MTEENNSRTWDVTDLEEQYQEEYLEFCNQLHRDVAYTHLSYLERKGEIFSTFASEIEKGRSRDIEQLQKQLDNLNEAGVVECSRSTLDSLVTAIENYNIWHSAEEREFFIEIAHFFAKRDKYDELARKTRNFQDTLPEDKYTPISELLLKPKTMDALRELGVLYIGELEVIAKWCDEDLSVRRKQEVIDSLRSDKNLLTYRQAQVRCTIDEEGKVVEVHKDDLHKLQPPSTALQMEDIVFSPHRLSNDMYHDIDEALKDRWHKKNGESK